MKTSRLLLTLLALTFASAAAPARAAADRDAVLSDLVLRGEISGENIVFTLSFEAQVRARRARIPLVAGDIAYRGSELPAKAKLARERDTFLLECPRRRGRQPVVFEFAGRAVKEDDWRRCTFKLPTASVRRLAVLCDRDDLEVRFPGALDTRRETTPQGRTEVSAYLGATDTFSVRWKPEVKKLEGELAVACDLNTIATASVGALRLDTVFSFRVIQGELERLALRLPAGVNVTQVAGKEIQDWRIDSMPGAAGTLHVVLSRPQDRAYRLQVESEMVLPAFPCSFDLPVFTPQDVIRTSGFLMIGSDSAIKLLVQKSGGLTQVEKNTFPEVRLLSDRARPRPTKSAFAYQYASMPYTVTLSADDIVPEYTADDRLVVALRDDELVFTGSVELDVRDAPARELTIETVPGWTVANVAGRAVSDYDVREQAGQREIAVYFKKGVLGRTLLDVRLEKPFRGQATSFDVPGFRVRGAKTERGHLVLAAEAGLRLKSETTTRLREVNTGTTPIKVAGAQQAFRFKEPGWSARVTVDRTRATMHAEVLHLISLGENVLYGSSSITYHVGGAPVRELVVYVAPDFHNVEFSGRDIRSWRREGDNWTVVLQERVLGDYNLLVTYDRQFSYETADLAVGGVRTVGGDSEAGYIVIASSASLAVEEKEKAGSVTGIDQNEVPKDYLALVNDPILCAYRYVKSPHNIRLGVARFETEQLLRQIVEHAALSTQIGREGESVTTARYFVKNAAKQYLVLNLPPGAQLWSVRSTGPGGKTESISSKRDGDRLLIPLRRPRDPNTSMQIELVYAEEHKKPGRLGGRLAFRAPSAPEAHASFGEWRFTVPADFAVAGTAGNMHCISAVSFDQGLTGVLVKILRLYLGLLRRAGGWILAVIACLAAGSLIAYNVARGRGILWGSVLGLMIALAGLFLGLAFQAACRTDGLDAFRVVFGAGRQGAPSAVAFSKAVNLMGSDPLAVSLRLVPAWLGGVGSVGLAVLGLAGGIVLLVAQRGRALSAAAGVTLLLLGLSQLAIGQKLLIACGALVLPVGLGSKMLRASRAAGRRKRDEPTEDSGLAPFVEDEADGPPPLSPDSAGPAKGNGGHTAPGLLPLLLLSAVLACTCLAGKSSAPPPGKRAAPVAPPPEKVINSVTLTIRAPAEQPDSGASAEVRMELAFETDAPGTFPVLDAGAAVTDFELPAKYLDLRSTGSGYEFHVARKGEYRGVLHYVVPVTEKAGRRSITFSLPANLRNEVTLYLPQTGLDVQAPAAVYFATEEQATNTVAVAAYGRTRHGSITWKPRERTAKLEQTVFFCDVNSFVGFGPGAVEAVHLVRYQVAQGELKALELTIPEEMSVTAVSAPGLGTWRFDPDRRLLEAVLDKPLARDFDLFVVTQITREALPYTARLGVPVVHGAGRQRGSIAIACPDSVQIAVDTTEGLAPMNTEDFSRAAAAAAHRYARAGRGARTRRAFRYHQTPVSAEVKAERVQSELRVAERASLSVSDERILLSTQLDVTIAKSGLFALRFAVPAGYDVETVSGPEITHWDELTDPERGVLVHFSKQMLGTRRVNIVLTRMEKRIEARIPVPRVSLPGARKHAGTLTVSGERGVRMTTAEREGVSEVNPRELGIQKSGLLAFRLLRPSWSVTLRAEVLNPLLKPEILQRVDLTEARLQARAYVRYKIENAGCKLFRVQAPEPGIALSFSGNDLAKAHEIDKEQGIWEVHLHNKAIRDYLLTVAYQLPLDAEAGRLTILPLRALDAEARKAYVVVTSSGRVEVKPAGTPAGLKAEGARGIPAVFRAGDLSDAILCYRAVRPDYRLELSVSRHGAAAVLPAKVLQAELTSVAAAGGHAIHRVGLTMDVGNLRFLEAALPGKNDKLWSALVDGKVATPAWADGVYRIPLESGLGKETSVELIYAGQVSSRWFSQRVVGPRLNVPLTKVRWTLYLPPGRHYYGFGGTMRRERDRILPQFFDAENYKRNNLRQLESNLARAQTVMAEGERYRREGKPELAKKAFQSAINWSQGKDDMNEDARIQYKNLVKQNAIVGLYNRRNAVRQQQNIQMDRQQPAAQGQQRTQEYAQQIEQSLSAADNESLRRVAEKIIDQQTAAAGLDQAITVTVPEHGSRVQFYRELQINPDAEMMVRFRSFRAGFGRRLAGLWPAVLVFAVAFWLLRRRAGRAAFGLETP